MREHPLQLFRRRSPGPRAAAAGLRRAWVALAVALAAACAHAAPVRVDIPAQSAARALIVLSRQTDIEVVFLYDDLKPVQSPAVRGEFEPAEALQFLLADSGFSVRATAAGKFVVVKNDEPPAPSVERTTAPLALAAPVPSRIGDLEPLQLDKFVVTPSRFGITEDLSARTATFTHDEVARLPQLGEDVFRAVAHVPGLAGSDFSAKFWVRGVSHDRVLTRLDGGTLLEPFHLKDIGGALSIIDLDTVSRLDLVTGGYTVEYGDRIGGLMLMETDRPVDARPRTTLGLSITGVRGTNRGTFAGGRGAWLLSGRLGYPDLTLAMANEEEITPRYHDVFGKVEFDVTPDHTLAVSVLSSRDRVRYLSLGDAVALTSRYRDDYAWLRWRAAFGERVAADTVLGHARLAWSRRSNSVPQANRRVLRRDFREERELEHTSLRQDWTVLLSPAAQIRAGFEATQGEAGYDIARATERWRVEDGRLALDLFGRSVMRVVDGSTFAGYAAWRQLIGKSIVVEPGLRYEQHDYLGSKALSPRLNVAATWRETTVRAAWGVFRQGQGVHELPVSDGETAFAEPERAEQIVLGIDRLLRAGLTMRLEVFRRDVDDPRPHWENLAHPVRLTGELDFDRVRLAPSRARAQGVEASVRHTTPHLRWSASYAWNRAEEEIDGRWRPVLRDQRHTLRLDATYSPNARWDFSAAWQYRSGWPTTAFDYDVQPLANGDFLFKARLGEPLAARLPAYHRLDLRVTRTWRGLRSTVRAFVDVFNVYSAKNSFRYDTIVEGPASDLRQVRLPKKSMPILPSVGVQWEF